MSSGTSTQSGNAGQKLSTITPLPGPVHCCHNIYIVEYWIYIYICCLYWWYLCHNIYNLEYYIFVTQKRWISHVCIAKYNIFAMMMTMAHTITSLPHLVHCCHNIYNVEYCIIVTQKNELILTNRYQGFWPPPLFHVSGCSLPFATFTYSISFAIIPTQLHRNPLDFVPKWLQMYSNEQKADVLTSHIQLFIFTRESQDKNQTRNPKIKPNSSSSEK